MLGIFGCSEKKTTIDNELTIFKVRGLMSKFDIQFKFPNTFVSVRDIDVENLADTTNLLMNWILNTQYEHFDYYGFYDSLDLTLNVFIRAGPRVDISNYERKQTYFTVPTIPLHKVFPAESEKRKIVYDSSEKKYNDKTYFKRKYQLIPDSLGFQEYFYISTEWQSTLVIVNSSKVSNLDKYLLDYYLVPKSEDDN